MTKPRGGSRGWQQRVATIARCARRADPQALELYEARCAPGAEESRCELGRRRGPDRRRACGRGARRDRARTPRRPRRRRDRLRGMHASSPRPSWRCASTTTRSGPARCSTASSAARPRAAGFVAEQVDTLVRLALCSRTTRAALRRLRARGAGHAAARPHARAAHRRGLPRRSRVASRRRGRRRPRRRPRARGRPPPGLQPCAPPGARRLPRGRRRADRRRGERRLALARARPRAYRPGRQARSERPRLDRHLVEFGRAATSSTQRNSAANRQGVRAARLPGRHPPAARGRATSCSTRCSTDATTTPRARICARRCNGCDMCSRTPTRWPSSTACISLSDDVAIAERIDAVRGRARRGRALRGDGPPRRDTVRPGDLRPGRIPSRRALELGRGPARSLAELATDARATRPPSSRSRPSATARRTGSPNWSWTRSRSGRVPGESGCASPTPWATTTA